MSNPERHFITCKMPFDFIYRRPSGNPKQLLLLLHGYSETGPKFLKQLEPVLPSDMAILAPNGPFPLPYKHEDRYKVGYSWYFYNPGDPDYFIDMSIATDFIAKGLESLGLSSLPKQIIGFSQGGYLAPILGYHLGNVSQVIGIGCEFLADEFPAGIKFRIDGIHGEKDEITPIEAARTSHGRLKELGIEGDFYAVSELGHRIDTKIQQKIVEILK